VGKVIEAPNRWFAKPFSLTERTPPLAKVAPGSSGVVKALNGNNLSQGADHARRS
jgi:hypothetical protein